MCCSALLPPTIIVIKTNKEGVCVWPQGSIVSSGGEEHTIIHILSLDEILIYEEFLPPLKYSNNYYARYVP